MAIIDWIGFALYILLLAFWLITLIMTVLGTIKGNVFIRGQTQPMEA